MQENSGDEQRDYISIRAFKLAGIVGYYGAFGFFWLADRHYQTGGIITNVGYCYGVAFMVAAFLASTGEQRMADIQAELDGGPDHTLADKIWAAGDQAAYWGAILAAIYFAYNIRIWDAIVSLGFPAWRLWLVLEIRRLKIRSGELRPSAFWKTAFFGCAAFTLLMLFLMFFTGYGPYKDIGFGSFQIYPALFITGIVCILVSFIGTGAKLD